MAELTHRTGTQLPSQMAQTGTGPHAEPEVSAQAREGALTSHTGAHQGQSGDGYRHATPNSIQTPALRISSPLRIPPKLDSKILFRNNNYTAADKAAIAKFVGTRAADVAAKENLSAPRASGPVRTSSARADVRRPRAQAPTLTPRFSATTRAFARTGGLFAATALVVAKAVASVPDPAKWQDSHTTPLRILAKDFFARHDMATSTVALLAGGFATYKVVQLARGKGFDGAQISAAANRVLVGARLFGNVARGNQEGLLAAFEILSAHYGESMLRSVVSRIGKFVWHTDREIDEIVGHEIALRAETADLERRRSAAEEESRTLRAENVSLRAAAAADAAKEKSGKSAPDFAHVRVVDQVTPPDGIQRSTPHTASAKNFLQQFITKMFSYHSQQLTFSDDETTLPYKTIHQTIIALLAQILGQIHLLNEAKTDIDRDAILDELDSLLAELTTQETSASHDDRHQQGQLWQQPLEQIKKIIATGKQYLELANILGEVNEELRGLNLNKIGDAANLHQEIVDHVNIATKNRIGSMNGADQNLKNLLETYVTDYLDALEPQNPELVAAQIQKILDVIKLFFQEEGEDFENSYLLAKAEKEHKRNEAALALRDAAQADLTIQESNVWMYDLSTIYNVGVDDAMPSLDQLPPLFTESGATEVVVEHVTNNALGDEREPEQAEERTEFTDEERAAYIARTKQSLSDNDVLSEEEWLAPFQDENNLPTINPQPLPSEVQQLNRPELLRNLNITPTDRAGTTTVDFAMATAGEPSDLEVDPETLIETAPAADEVAEVELDPDADTEDVEITDRVPAPLSTPEPPQPVSPPNATATFDAAAIRAALGLDGVTLPASDHTVVIDRAEIARNLGVAEPVQPPAIDPDAAGWSFGNGGTPPPVADPAGRIHVRGDLIAALGGAPTQSLAAAPAQMAPRPPELPPPFSSFGRRPADPLPPPPPQISPGGPSDEPRALRRVVQTLRPLATEAPADAAPRARGVVPIHTVGATPRPAAVPDVDPASTGNFALPFPGTVGARPQVRAFPPPQVGAPLRQLAPAVGTPAPELREPPVRRAQLEPAGRPAARPTPSPAPGFAPGTRPAQLELQLPPNDRQISLEGRITYTETTGKGDRIGASLGWNERTTENLIKYMNEIFTGFIPDARNTRQSTVNHALTKILETMNVAMDSRTLHAVVINDEWAALFYLQMAMQYRGIKTEMREMDKDGKRFPVLAVTTKGNGEIDSYIIIDRKDPDNPYLSKRISKNDSNYRPIEKNQETTFKVHRGGTGL